ncbi:MAG: signal peptide peptidase SppA [Bacteroidales bacterium]|jgi:protease-4|nr:signal peptide peptidase SppA [Bacteroidales bacterium]MDD2569717.1 signal peptide peptidase SppA [Bacteroidales bacterium]MDD2811870.1 signal peptide peptidase SppA [Bacteroidales bacterium]MDD3384181.1 signal peptide peptidase SppA [Bacteroidales bacterium]MDD3810825.1 signal peptide peptidase SppA [Bacteroidales bacterium]
MKGFLKYFLASFLAILLALLAIFLLGLGSFSALFSSKPEVIKLKPNTVLVVDLNKPITDRTIDSPFDVSSLQGFGMGSSIGLYEVVNNLQKAAEDPDISGVLILTGQQANGLSSLDEIRNALAKFKESGKFVFAYSNIYSQGSYFVASVADKVFLNPLGILEFRGLRAETMFYKEALDKIGIDMQIIRQGRFKAAVEPFQQQSMSPENREQLDAYLQAIWNRIITAVGESRDLTAEQLNLIADQWSGRSPEGAVKAGLVDSLLYEDQVQDLLKELTNTKSTAKLSTVSISKYTNAASTAKEDYTADRIAVIYGTGSIAMESTGPQSIGANLAKTIQKARLDKKTKAIVFRVNSPGGDALASEVIRREVELAAQEKPVIISMGDLAASGGYWISTPGSKIVAGPTTLTGSIGAFGMIPNAEKLLKDKIGLTIDGVQTNELAGAGTIFRPLTEAERALFMDQLKQTYSYFLNQVSKFRKMPVEEVDRIGEGRIWAGVTAKELGLVDEIGGLHDAIRLAASEAGLATWRVREMPQLKDPINQIIESLMGKSSPEEELLTRHIPIIQDIKEMINSGRMQARLPYRIEVY